MASEGETAGKYTLVSVFALVGLQGVPVWAQAEPGLTEDPLIEEILVTGSRIARRDFTSISPIASLDELELTLSGTINVEDALNAMPQTVPDWGRTNNNPVTNGGDGGARINLRGLEHLPVSVR